MSGESEFFSGISGDRSFLLLPDELGQFVPACCAMANGAGGWIIVGAAMKDSASSEDAFPELEGVPDADALEKQLSDILRGASSAGAGLVSHFRTFPSAGNGKKILAARVEPSDWRLRPLRVDKEKHAYRRIEGENVISGRDTRWRMALDALESSRDDFSVPGLTVADLDRGGVASFMDKLIAKFPDWNSLSEENFLKRALVLDEDGGVTRAGELLLGQNSNLVRISEHDVPNLWSACEIFLPQMTKGLPAPCAAALKECFVNAMIHAEHDAGVINVEFSDEMVIFSNPGLPRSLKNGKSQARNYRLMRIFLMAGQAAGDGRGLGIIREYDAGFRLYLDMLELATVSALRLPAAAGPDGPEPDEPELAGPKKPRSINYGWMPVVQEKAALRAMPEAQLPAPEPEPHEEETYEDEYLGTADEGGESEKFSQLVRQVRDTPRMPPDIVRDAILELCADYKSISELAATLARSESSLRRHYVTSMTREGLLEMEFPDRVGHPDQRYRTRNN